MVDLDKALATQVANIEKKTGKSMAQLTKLVAASKLAKHSELVAMLKETLGLGHGDANTVVHLAKKSTEPAAAKGSSTEAVLDGLYTGPKAALRPIHDKLLAAMKKFGAFEEAPKKSYVSYRRNKQFAMVGPATNTRVEVGLNIKGLPANARLLDQGTGKMCNYVVRLTDPKEVDAELLDWIRSAYDAAG
ncbi:MAG: DUF4287 domain-containing protein [Planctomycetaceae bacterium]|nr:DUF4287 domain-containing protein [Planctomycetaceae bacterium]